MKSDKLPFWELLIGSLPKAPWGGFFWGLFLPLTLMRLFKLFHSTVFGVIVGLSCCVLFFVVNLTRTKRVNIFPLMTFFMVSTQFAAGMHAVYYPRSVLAMSLLTGIDNGLVALVFLGSLLLKKPLILAFLDENKLKSIPAEIRGSSFYLRAWSLITLVWGLAYFAQSIILSLLRLTHSPAEAPVDFFCSWPIVVILLTFSVMFPRWYWTRKMGKIAKEAESK